MVISTVLRTSIFVNDHSHSPSITLIRASPYTFARGDNSVATCHQLGNISKDKFNWDREKGGGGGGGEEKGEIQRSGRGTTHKNERSSTIVHTIFSIFLHGIIVQVKRITVILHEHC